MRLKLLYVCAEALWLAVGVATIVGGLMTTSHMCVWVCECVCICMVFSLKHRTWPRIFACVAFQGQPTQLLCYVACGMCPVGNGMTSSVCPTIEPPSDCHCHCHCLLHAICYVLHEMPSVVALIATRMTVFRRRRLHLSHVAHFFFLLHVFEEQEGRSSSSSRRAAQLIGWLVGWSFNAANVFSSAAFTRFYGLNRTLIVGVAVALAAVAWIFGCKQKSKFLMAMNQMNRRITN